MTIETRTAPRQDRSVKRLDSLLAAATAVYEEKGRDRFTTNDVAERAGSAIGTVYRYFEDRVALMDAVAPDRDKADEKLKRVKERLEQAIAGDLTNSEATASAIVDALEIIVT